MSTDVASPLPPLHPGTRACLSRLPRSLDPLLDVASLLLKVGIGEAAVASLDPLGPDRPPDALFLIRCDPQELRADNRAARDAAIDPRNVEQVLVSAELSRSPPPDCLGRNPVTREHSAIWVGSVRAHRSPWT